MKCRTTETGNPGTFEFIVIEVKKEMELGLAGWVPAEIEPEGTPTEAVASVSVRTVMPVALPAVAAPIVRPLRVMTTGVQAPMLAPPVVMMMRVGAGADGNAHMPDTDAAKVGVAVGAKKSEG